MNFPPLFMPLYVGLLWLAATTPLLAQPSITATPPTAHQSRSPIAPVLFKPSGGPPPTTRGAGSRNDRSCAPDAPANPSRATAQPLTALVPPHQTSLTWAERPTFWVYLPQTSARQIVLSVQAKGAGQHSQRFLPITGAAGIVGIPIAATAPPLEVGKAYQWAIVLVCGDRPSPNDPVVTAWVQRANPAPRPQPPLNHQPTALEQAVGYAEQGIWYDALTTLAAARQSQPDNPAVTKIWAEFLAQPSVGLGAIAKEPVL
jgi:hypothetical protein